ncbi:hypothetical protein SCUCBS95973_004625 [Sporothrix curviconia]|uniref:F-box domain-containing protein n=1 Tax=Sporothrix curviconia TaxID=1260050 RepID=A0ABP0BQB0_9PEZI
MAGHQAALDRLPDDILYLIIDNLDTARDQANLSKACHRLYDFMQSEGWRAFSRRCFPGVASADHQGHAGFNGVSGINGANGANGVNGANGNSQSQPRAGASNKSDDGAPGWRALAESLTWQSRAWDRRALAFQALLARQDHIPRHKRPRPFRPALAVHFQTELAEGGKQLGLGVDGEEMLVVGAGEDIVARFRRRGRKGRQGKNEAGEGDSPAHAPVWHVVNGQDAGFRPGYDDIRTMSVINNAMGIRQKRGLLVGRESGDVSLVSAEPDETFGRPLAQFLPEKAAQVDQSRVYSIDVSTDHRNTAALGASNSQRDVAAITTPSDILFYSLPQTENNGSFEAAADGLPAKIHPITAFPMGDAGLYHNGVRQPFNARWMEADGLLAVALGAGSTPLRYLTMTPTGAMELTSAYTPPELMEHHYLKDTTLVLPSSLTPVAASTITGGNGHLVLSGWRDGTCRLQDLRTASSYDLIYQDNVLGPQENAQAILLWGTERFITGSQESAALKIFDLRWPRRYYHTDALPCSSQMPWPTPPMPMGAPGSMGMGNSEGAHLRAEPSFLPPAQRNAGNWPPKSVEMPLYLEGTRRCDMMKSIRCRWHTASRNLFYRSSSALFLQRSLEDNGVKGTGVHTLARAASDLAPANFYAGLNNCVVESFLYEDVVAFESPRKLGSHRAPIWTDGGPAPYFGYPKAPSSEEIKKGSKSATASAANSFVGSDFSFYRTVDIDVAVMETGDSMARPNVESQPMWLPRIRSREYDFDRVPKGLFDKTTKLGMRDYERRGPDADARHDETARIEEWKSSHGLTKAPNEKVTFRDQYLHRLDFGLQSNDDFV